MTKPIAIPLPEADPDPNDERNHNPYIIAAILALSIVVLLFYRLSGAQVERDSKQYVPVPDRAHSGYIVVDVSGAVLRPNAYRLRVGSRVFDAVASAGGLRPDADRARVNMAAKLRDEMKLHVPTVGEAAVAVPAQTPADEVPPEVVVPESGSPVEPDRESSEPVSQAPANEDPPVAAILPPSTPAAPLQTPEPVPAATGTPQAAAPPVVPASARISINRAGADELEKLPGVGPKLAQDIVNYRKGPPPRAFTSLQELANVPGIKDSKLEEILPYVKL